MRIEAGRFKGRNLPRARGARPVGGRLRSSLFQSIEALLEGARVLDLFAGIGGLGLEALSRGAAEVVLVEKDPRAAQALGDWIEAVGATEEARVLRRDALVGALPAGPFDLVFADPPYALWKGPEAPALLARAVAPLGPSGRLVLKIQGRQPLPADPRWREIRRRDVGSNAWVLLAPPEAGDSAVSVVKPDP